MTTDDPIRFRTFADDDDPAWAARARTGGERSSVAAPPRKKSPILARGAGFALLAGAAIAVVLLPGHSALQRDPSSSTATLQVRRYVTPPTRLTSAALLPCYVGGVAVGSRSLSDCAQRNGVASGRLDVGSSRGPAEAADGPPARLAVARAEPFPEAAPRAMQPRPRDVDSQPPPPVDSYDGASDQPRLDPEDSIRAAQTFYESLAQANGARAASVVVPEKRANGPLSAGAITRFYSSLRAPLRLTRLYPLDDHTVMARYAFVDPDGAVCQGSARVTTTERDGEVYVKSVRALDGC